MGRFRRLVLGIAVLLLGVLLATGLVAAAMLNMTHASHTVRRDVPGAEVVQIAGADGTVLKASWLAPPAESERCVLFLHGSGGWRERGARFTPLLREESYGVLAPDSRGHGESGGDRVTAGILEKYDALAWVKWMRALGCRKIYGLGESMGAAVLILTAEMEPVFTAIVADSSFADLLAVAKVRIMRQVPLPNPIARPLVGLAAEAGSLFARVFLDLDFASVRPVESIKHVNVPILLIQGTADELTPPADARALAAAKPDTTELWLAPGAGHVRSFSTQPKEYGRKVVTWFRDH